jgi:hypothetical protein
MRSSEVFASLMDYESDTNLQSCTGKTIVFASGKRGVGKTAIVGSFSVILGDRVPSVPMIARHLPPNNLM